MPPPAGYLDLHCHILPGIDDGCQTLEQSLDVVRQWLDAGFVGAVCTPHVCTSWFPANHPGLIGPWVEALRVELANVELDFQLWTGGELRLGTRMIDWLAEFGVPTLDAGKAVLIDWWGNDWPKCCDEGIDHLLERGYQPILAHPERMGLELTELMSVLDRVRERGVLLQGNLNSIGGGEGPHAQGIADLLLAEDAYHLLASDTHGPDSVRGRKQGLARFRERFGDDALRTMLVDRPRALLGL